MRIIKIGVDYRATPLDIREKLTFRAENMNQAMLALNEKDHVRESKILSTCNRTEIFAVVEDEGEGKQEITEFFTEWFQIEPPEFLPYLKFETDEEVIRHAFQLAAGLESMVLGETQILGQVKAAFMLAQQNNVTGKHLNELFRRVVTFGKRAHHETVIGQLAVSVSYVAVELSKKLFGDIRGKHAVIIGAGEMGESSLKNLHGAGVSELTVVNRSFENAESLARRYQADAVPMEKLNQILAKADIVISSTGASEVILTKDQLEDIQSQRGNRPLLLVDIAVPRDIDERAADLEHVYLYDMDDLQSVTNENMEKRQRAAAFLEAEIENEIESYKEWVNMQEVVPIIKALNEKTNQIQETTLESVTRKIPDLDEREVKVVQKHIKSIITQLLDEPIKQVKQMGKRNPSDEEIKTFINIFGLEDNLNR